MFKSKKESALKRVESNRHALQYLPEFQDDKDVVLAALQNTSDAYNHASKRL